jgi:hypothetical protein
MQRSAAVLGGVVVLAVLNGCVADRTGPNDLPNLSLTASPTLACNIALTRDYAHLYVASSQDPIYQIIDDLQAARSAGNMALATDLVLDGWSRIAAIRLTSAQKNGTSGVEGNALARGLAGCGDPTFVAAVGNDIDFTAALNSGGLFEVRGDDSKDPPTTPAYPRGAVEIWAAHPQIGNTWESSASARHAIYGYPVQLGSNDPLVTSQGFEFETAPSNVAYTLPIVRGVCNVSGATVRIQRNQSLLPLIDLDCASVSTASRSSGSEGVLFAVARQIANVFMPRELNATALIGGVAGLLSDFSPHTAVDLVSVGSGFTSQPLNGFVNKPIPGDGSSGVVQVRITSAAGTPLPGVLISLSVTGNKGTNVVLSNGTAVTDDAGIASFPNLSVNKAGGYTLSADGTYDGITGSTGISALFNIKNK